MHHTHGAPFISLLLFSINGTQGQIGTPAGRFYLIRFAARPEVGPYLHMQGATFPDPLRQGRLSEPTIYMSQNVK
jgi:hypothetical protein